MTACCIVKLNVYVVKYFMRLFKRPIHIQHTPLSLHLYALSFHHNHALTILLLILCMWCTVHYQQLKHYNCIFHLHVMTNNATDSLTLHGLRQESLAFHWIPDIYPLRPRICLGLPPTREDYKSI